MNEQIEEKIEKKDFKILLQTEFEKRCQKNPRYSLRAFAKSLGVNHGILSQFLRGKRSITARSVRSLAPKLGLAPDQMGEYVAYHERPTRGVRAINIKEEKYEQLSLDEYHCLSQWHYDAIIELTHLPHFLPDYQWIASKLGIGAIEVQIAVERLIRTKKLIVLNNGKWKDTSQSNRVLPNHITSLALRNLQTQIVQMSLDSLEQHDLADRSHSSTVMTIAKKDLPEIKRLIREFRHSLSSFTQRAEEGLDSLYQLQVGFFPLAKDLAPEPEVDQVDSIN